MSPVHPLLSRTRRRGGVGLLVVRPRETEMFLQRLFKGSGLFPR